MTSKVAVVTGASSGIGAACARRLARAGWRVVGISRSGTIEGVPELATNLSAHSVDITSEADLEALFDRVVEQLGRLDALVNAAGVAVAGALEDTPPEWVRWQLETNLVAAALLSRAAVPRLRRCAPSVLLHISSLAGRVALPYQSVYCASKFGLEGLCESLRHELEPHRVRVVLVQPGSVRTPLTRNRRTAAASEAYVKAAQAALRINDDDERAGVDPDVIARMVERALEGRLLSSDLPAGHWRERLSWPVKRLLPSGWFRRIVAMHYRR